ncbi:MAG: SAM-dependent methyltransferase [Rickettsiaceae bacterium]|nr:SAM-dependent methyltransferase [Rickettsiaceae bacterium]
MDLSAKILKRIHEKGFITIDEFMDISLIKYDSSYYQSKNPLDLSSGDFITSPQISQMFGEMVGVWVYNQWILMNKPKSISLVEFGPGTGLLMRDILRVLAKTELLELLDIIMVEKSASLEKIQKEELTAYDGIKWQKDINELPNQTSIFVSNEFFDVFPIKQYIKKGPEFRTHQNSAWQEIVISEKSGDIGFDTIQVEDDINIYLKNSYPNAMSGAIVEESPSLDKFIANISSHIKTYNSTMLAIDYGYDIEAKSRKPQTFQQTLQAIKDHKFCDILENIGTCDITSHVNFAKIRYVAENQAIRATNTMSQNEFLHLLGITERMDKLVRSSSEYADIVRAQYKRLVSPEQMGLLFKAISLSKKDQQIFIFDEREDG